MNDILIIDGYNVLNADASLEKLKKHNFEHARQVLTDRLHSYSCYKNYRTYLVFDAHEVIGGKGQEERVGLFSLIYTKQGETADSYIEKLTYSLVKRDCRVYVVTSDRTEQIMVLWMGAYRITAQELLRDCYKASREISDKFSPGRDKEKRNELGDRLNKDVALCLERLRRRR